MLVPGRHTWELHCDCHVGGRGCRATGSQWETAVLANLKRGPGPPLLALPGPIACAGRIDLL
eukprot:8751466-Lingulodinium_polyedra.AAC.1